METLIEHIKQYMDAGFPILYLKTFNTEKGRQIIDQVADRRILTWNVEGLFDSKEGIVSDATGRDLGLQLENWLHDFATLNQKILVLENPDFYFSKDYPNHEIFALKLKKLVEKILRGELDCTIIILSSQLPIPIELEHYITLLTMDALSTDEIESIITEFCQEQEVPSPLPKVLRTLAEAFRGLPEYEIQSILALALSNDGDIDLSDLHLIAEQKAQMIQKSGILEMVSVKESIDDIGGLENLKEWLKQKAKIVKNFDEAKQYGVDLPKGVLIAGLPGCGKSLNAKVAATLFGVPLIRMDMGRLMGKYVGESDQNMRRAIALAEAISPCILWIDEIEKAFAGIGNGGGSGEVTTRLFGYFLTWLQEKQNLTFVVATANQINRMPAELLRKGRFDEIFYVDLPNEEERRKIFEIHVKKRRPQDLNNIDFSQLARRSNGYSGADIEGVVKMAIEEGFVQDKLHISTEGILTVLNDTPSLKTTMSKAIDELTKFYKENKFRNASR